MSYEFQDVSPTANQTMIRSNEGSASITIEALTQKRFEEARKIETDFMTTDKGFCFGLCPYIWCPPTQKKVREEH